jgi:hypothetical protein
MQVTWIFPTLEERPVADLYLFLCGVGGSLIVELATAYQHYEREAEELPARYNKRGFWLVRALMAVAAGWLVILYEVDKPLLAANIGASAPLLIQMLAKGYRPSYQTSKAKAEETALPTAETAK